MQSTKEREEKKANEEILQLLSKPTAKVRPFTVLQKKKKVGDGDVVHR